MTSCCQESQSRIIAHPQLGAVLGDQVADMHATVADRTEVIRSHSHESLICIRGTSNFKLVQMRIRPAHGHLN